MAASRSLTVGAYPTYAAAPALADAIIAGLAESDRIGGLELPWHGSVAVPAGPSHWRHVVTLIPGTMARLADDPSYGLASPDPDGRRRALADLAHVRDEVAAAAPAIRAVEVHSAPRGTASADACHASLTEAAGWDWSGAELVIEHCDAWRVADTVQKGFLPYDAELAVARTITAATPVRVGLNWARSVIETGDPATPEQQLAAAAPDGMLGALMFSPVSDRATAFGPAWLDAHLAPAGSTGAEPGTLLTVDHMRRCVQAAGPSYDGVLGFKVGLTPDSLTAAERVRRLLEIVAMLDAAIAQS